MEANLKVMGKRRMQERVRRQVEGVGEGGKRFEGGGEPGGLKVVWEG